MILACIQNANLKMEKPIKVWYVVQTFKKNNNKVYSNLEIISENINSCSCNTYISLRCYTPYPDQNFSLYTCNTSNKLLYLFSNNLQKEM